MDFAALARTLLHHHDGVTTTIRLPSALPPVPIMSLLPDRDGTVWISVDAGGLFRLRNGRLSSITVANGAPDIGFFGLIDDHLGNIWAASNQGIYGFRRSELEAVADGHAKFVHPITIGIGEGMRSIECDGPPSGSLASDGTIWVATTKGAIQFDPREVLRRRPTPSAFIESVSIDHHLQRAGESKIPAGSERIEISYTAMHYSDPDAVRFRYMLEGFDKGWIDAGSHRVAEYMRLPPGRYRFRVMASVDHGAWSSSDAGRELVQEPHFYETKWFAVVASIGVLAVLWVLYALRVAVLHRRQRALEGLVAERTELLEAASHQNEIILESAAEGIVGVNAGNRIIFANDAAKAVLGKEAIGQSLHALIHPQEPRDGCSICDPPSSATQTATVLFRTHDGRMVPVDVTTNWLRGGRGIVITFRDVSARVAVEQMKDEFVATVSHELRTPLTAIRGAVGLIGAKGDAAARRLVDMAVRNCDRLLRLVNELLDSERLVSGRMELRQEGLDAASVIEQSTDLMQSIAREKNVHVVGVPVALPLSADRDRIVQLLTNLIGNAIKFSPPGGIVRLTAEQSGSGEAVLFHVSDQGRGIPPEKLGSIFERFRQVDAADAHEKGGSGLGLAICRGIAEAHGGSIWVESEMGVGSTFTASIPRGNADLLASA
jgi:PAS domain S-box-containing protein